MKSVYDPMNVFYPTRIHYFSKFRRYPPSVDVASIYFLWGEMDILVRRQVRDLILADDVFEPNQQAEGIA